MCVDGYTGVGGSYTCVVTDEDTNSVGWNGSTSCQRSELLIFSYVLCPSVLLHNYTLVPCPELLKPPNGMIDCSLGDDEVYSYEDTCSFTCNTGYELAGSDTRTCQSDGSWSGSDNFCMRGKFCFTTISYKVYIEQYPLNV